MRPSEIRFTHDSIQSSFRDGRSITETFREILLQNLVIEDLPLMELMEYGSEWFVVRGNRRLFMFQELEKRGYLQEVKVHLKTFDPVIFQSQYTSTNKGKSVRIRGYGQNIAVSEELDQIWSEYMSRKFSIMLRTLGICSFHIVGFLLSLGKVKNCRYQFMHTCSTSYIIMYYYIYMYFQRYQIYYGLLIPMLST